MQRRLRCAVVISLGLGSDGFLPSSSFAPSTQSHKVNSQCPVARRGGDLRAAVDEDLPDEDGFLKPKRRRTRHFRRRVHDDTYEV